MTHADPSDEPDLAAGDHATWLEGTLAAIRGERPADVPCDGCTACCRSAQFVHIGPDETDTLAHIPSALLFAAPGRPDGHVLLGYDEHGHCPMLVDDGCSIYDHRPVTCRTYDCRVFAATGVEIDEGSKAPIADRVRRWRFTFATESDLARADAVRRAGAYLAAHADELPTEALRNGETARAVAAVEIHDAFLHGEPDIEAVRVQHRRRRAD